MQLYPMKLESVNKDIIWGGTLLSREYHKSPGKWAEAWELAVHPEGDCRILNGAYAGRRLSEFSGIDGDFPIMIKLIDACDRLSIQVHPAKTEMWYIADAAEGAALVYGLKEPFCEETFRAALAAGTVEDLLNYVPVHKGDVFFIPQGMVHAIGAGILIAEIQQNSNVTYRVYDYGRLRDGKPRALHVEQAMETIRDFTAEEIAALRYRNGKPSPSCLADCSFFRTDRYEINGSLTLTAGKKFLSLICLSGSGTVGDEPMLKGDSFFLPAGLGSVTVSGRAELLVTQP